MLAVFKIVLGIIGVIALIVSIYALWRHKWESDDWSDYP